jgi:hypothetical protein
MAFVQEQKTREKKRQSAATDHRMALAGWSLFLKSARPMRRLTTKTPRHALGSMHFTTKQGRTSVWWRFLSSSSVKTEISESGTKHEELSPIKTEG